MKKITFITTFTISSLILPLSVEASSFSKINVFGDSLVDTGNVFNLTKLPPDPPYFEGRFSNQKIWIDILTKNFNINPVLFSEIDTTIPNEGINFAFGGATTNSANAISNSLFGLQQQIKAFTDLTAIQQADETALNIIWAGANDYFQALSNPNSLTESLAEQVTGNLSSGLQLLYEAGARNFLVVNLPDIGNTPLIKNEFDILLPGISTQLNNLVLVHNLLLEQKINTLNNQFSDVNLITLDANSLFQEIFSAPSQFGFSNADSSCLINSQLLPAFSFDDICDNPREFVFWDDIHPTAATHQLVAQLALDTLQATEPVPESNIIIGLLFFILTLFKIKNKATKNSYTN